MSRSITHPICRPTVKQFISVRAGVNKDIDLIVSLQKRFSNQLGFLPRQSLEAKLSQNRILIASINGDPVGYLAHGSFRWSEAWIFQCAVRPDAQRENVGRVLTRRADANAAAAGVGTLLLKCREDLDALFFWPAIGFNTLDVRDVDNARRKKIVVMGRETSDGTFLTHHGTSLNRPRRTALFTPTAVSRATAILSDKRTSLAALGLAALVPALRAPQVCGSQSAAA